MGCDPGSVHTVLYTVPYMSESQPVERVWAVMKHFVAKKHHRGRTAQQLRVDIIDGFYGTDDGTHSGVTAQHCQRFIEHAKKEVNGWISADPFLTALFPRDIAPTVDALTASIADAYLRHCGGMVIPLDADGDPLVHPAFDEGTVALDLTQSEDAALEELITATNAQYGAAAPQPKRAKPRAARAAAAKPKARAKGSLQPPAKRQKTLPRRRCAAPAPYE